MAKFVDIVKCRGCRLDKCLVAGMDPPRINVPHSDKFKKFLANLKKRKMKCYFFIQKEETHVMRNGRIGTKQDEAHSVDEAHDHVSCVTGGAHHDE
ncbi:hypothetical protein niasHS_000240 [Heterodera schachtii]|uniref:Nuclear receptor domain-containing protein n=1 Tax=Heterodera schachtii TaxID=97005 RepID=A0ABD2KHJ1_HETSC